MGEKNEGATVHTVEISEMNAEQLETRRAEITEELRTADSARMDELERDISAIEARSKELNAQRERDAESQRMEERRAAMSAVLGGSGTVIGRPPGVETRSREERLSAVLGGNDYLNAYIRGIQTNNYKECRAMVTELVTDGDVPVPQYIHNIIENTWDDTAILPRLNQAFFRGTGRFPFEISSSAAVVHQEGADAPAEGKVKIGTVLITPKNIIKWLPYSDETVALGGQQFVDHVYKNVEHEVFLKCEAETIAAMKSAPVNATKEKASVRDLEVSEIDVTTMFQALGELSSRAQNPVALMNRKTYFGKFMSLIGTDGHPVYNIVSDNGKPTYFINGVEVLFTDALAENTEFIVADLSAVTINAPGGFSSLKFTTDPYSMAEKGMIKVVGSLMAGFGVTKDKHIVRVKVSSSGSGSGSGSGDGQGGGDG